MRKKKNIGIVCGGTGGHVLPAITFGEYLDTNYINFSFYVDKRGIKYINENSKIWNYINKKSICNTYHRNPFLRIIYILCNFFHAFKFVKNTHTIVSFGSYHAVSVLLIAILLNRKIILFQIDVLLSRVNRLFLPFCNYCCFSIFVNKNDYTERISRINLNPLIKEDLLRNFQSFLTQVEKYNKKIITTGLPIRETFIELAQISDCKNKDCINEKKNSETKRPFKLLVLGGSLGSKDLNALTYKMINSLSNHIKENLSIIHYSFDKFENHYDSNVKVFFMKQFNSHEYLAHLSESDLVICRGGACTLYECAFLKKNMIVIPLPTSINDHQKINAIAFSDDVLIQEEIEKDIRCFENLFLKKYEEFINVGYLEYNYSAKPELQNSSEAILKLIK